MFVVSAIYTMDIACDECKEVFTTNTDLFNHQRVHKADKKSHDAVETKLLNRRVPKKKTPAINQIHDLETEDKLLNSVNKTIFKKSTIKKFQHILALLNQNKIDEIIEKHQTLKILCRGLVCGVIPVCEVQRRKVSDVQRRLVDNILDLPSKESKMLLQSKKNDLLKLLRIVDKSLKFIVKTFLST